MVPVLVVDGDKQDGVDVSDVEGEDPVPSGRHSLVLGVGAEHSVVQLEDGERVRLASEVGSHQTSSRICPDLQVADVVDVGVGKRTP